MIVFVRSSFSTGGDHSVHIMNQDGQNLVKITPVGAFGVPFSSESAWPSIAPDQQHILFTNGIENHRIAIMDVDGMAAKYLSPADVNYDITAPSFSSDGQHIVFSSTMQGNADIYVMNADGTNVQALTHLSGTSDAALHPRYSRINGGSIVYELNHYDHNTNTNTRDIWVMNADGSNQHAVTNDGKSFDPSTGILVGDIVFVSRRDGNSEIYSMNLDGTNVKVITAAHNELASFQDPDAN